MFVVFYLPKTCNGKINGLKNPCGKESQHIFVSSFVNVCCEFLCELFCEFVSESSCVCFLWVPFVNSVCELFCEFFSKFFCEFVYEFQL